MQADRYAGIVQLPSKLHLHGATKKAVGREGPGGAQNSGEKHHFPCHRIPEPSIENDIHEAPNNGAIQYEADYDQPSSTLTEDRFLCVGKRFPSLVSILKQLQFREEYLHASAPIH